MPSAQPSLPRIFAALKKVTTAASNSWKQLEATTSVLRQIPVLSMRQVNKLPLNVVFDFVLLYGIKLEIFDLTRYTATNMHSPSVLGPHGTPLAVR